MGFVNGHLFRRTSDIEREILQGKKRGVHPLAYEEAEELAHELNKQYAIAAITDLCVPRAVTGGPSAVSRFEAEAAKIAADRSRINPNFARELDRVLARVKAGQKPIEQGRIVLGSAGGRYTERTVGIL